MTDWSGIQTAIGALRKDKILEILAEVDHPDRKKFTKRKTQESPESMAIAAAAEIRKQILRTRT